ncbi:hypothetical protein C8N46_1126 [Kordia periserrulae]|uniref:Uncharacterized protein n=2 Tax=Kordia periserrulae TaxID=701523 RepID=A0A2T6BRK1_9FLAO|nr:hypothetical protein C8N46_1126 [Kordia periserrulae]
MMNVPGNFNTIMYTIIVVLISISALNILYHIKSFRFYRRKENQRLDKKLHKLFWVIGFAFPIFLFVLLSFSVYGNSARFASGLYSADELVLVVILFVVSIVEFTETVQLQKRIKKLRETRDIKMEIDDIGEFN